MASSKLQFVGFNDGWIAAGQELLATVDGGRTWTRQLSLEEQLSGVQFIDLAHGWTASETRLWRTTDGGANWEPLSEQVLTSFQFLTPDVGWGVEGGHEESVGLLVKTTDGGLTWDSQDLQVNSICFADYGWATGPSPRGVSLFQTLDNGKNWTETAIPLLNAEKVPYEATVKCSGIDAWVLVTGDAGAGHISYALFRTNEGGPTVTPVLQDGFTHPLGSDGDIPVGADPYPGPFSVYGGVTARFITWCPACGPTAAVMRTTSAGALWKRFELPQSTAGEPIGVSFVEEDFRTHLGYKGKDATGWLALTGTLPNVQGETSNIFFFKTSDGGETWQMLGIYRSPSE